MKRILGLVVWIFMCVLPLWAQSSSDPLPMGYIPPIDINQYPTYVALMDTIIPRADRLDLAQRLFGYEPLNMRASADPRVVGETQSFFVLNTASNQMSSIIAELTAVGDHVYVWVEQPMKLDPKALDTFTLRFDTEIYPQVRELWGSEPSPGIDGDVRIYLLFTNFINPSVDGYFTSQNIYPSNIVPFSNQHEMMVFSLPQLSNQIGSDYLLSRAAHEFQHMVRHNVDGNESAWMDEGFSVFTEKYLGLNNNAGMAIEFINNPNTQLNDWGAGLPSYGASLMFMSYFYERFGMVGMQALSNEPADSLVNVDKTLQALGYSGGVDVFFADWVLANTMQRPDLGFGYTDWWEGLPTALPITQVSAYPYTNSTNVNQYATHYYDLTNLQNSTTLNIQLDKPSEASLLTDAPPRGTYYVYSNEGDESATRLTRAFDLTGLTSATLQYGVWYNLESMWDYAYIQVSADGGQSWQLLSSLRTTTDNPNARAYGAGYTGESIGWKGDRVDLSAYAGQQILLRFEMVTDDAKTNPGIALDEISIPELNYIADFESGDDGWQMEGWIRSDNRLPQRAWVQVVQYVGSEASITRYLADGIGNYQVVLLPNVERVTLAISPFTLSTVPMPYTLTLSTQ
jgi:immune inhibitor A